MIVVADGTPLHYLMLVQHTPLLRHFYSQPPSWLEIAHVRVDEMASVAEHLDLGERAAIALAERARADLLLIDETAGRAEATRRGFRVTGTLGVLRAAATEGLIDVREVLNRLAETNFYTDERLLRKLVARG